MPAVDDPEGRLPDPDHFERRVPQGDDRSRLVCRDCGFVAYENPKIVVGSVAAWQGRILLCRRAIEPRRGFWTLPAGFLELQENAAAGARPQAWEEAPAELEIDQDRNAHVEGTELAGSVTHGCPRSFKKKK